MSSFDYSMHSVHLSNNFLSLHSKVTVCDYGYQLYSVGVCISYMAIKAVNHKREWQTNKIRGRERKKTCLFELISIILFVFMCMRLKTQKYRFVTAT